MDSGSNYPVPRSVSMDLGYRWKRVDDWNWKTSTRKSFYFVTPSLEVKIIIYVSRKALCTLQDDCLVLAFCLQLAVSLNTGFIIFTLAAG